MYIRRWGKRLERYGEVWRNQIMIGLVKAKYDLKFILKAVEHILKM